MNNLEKFVAAYTETLNAAIAANEASKGRQYAPCGDVPAIARKMTLGLASGTALLGPAGKAAAKFLGIQPTYKAIRAYFAEDDKPITAEYRKQNHPDAPLPKAVHFIINRKLNRAEILTAVEFQDWEIVQGTFRVGFKMSDGNSADGIGRCKSIEEFERKAKHGGTLVLSPQLQTEGAK